MLPSAKLNGSALALRNVYSSCRRTAQLPPRLTTKTSHSTRTLILGICLAFLLLEGWREWTSREAAVQRAEQEMSNLAHSLRQHADDTFQMAELALANLVDHFETEGTGDTALERARAHMDANLRDNSRLRALHAFGADGSWLVNSLDADPPGANNADRDYFQHHQAIDDRVTFVGPPVQSRTGGQWVVTLSRRINDAAGQFAGVVAATITSKSFADYYRQLDVGAAGSIILASKDGLVLSRTPFDEAVIGRDISASPLFAEAVPDSHQHGLLRYVSPIDQVKRIGGYDGSARYGFFVMAGAAEEQVLANWASGAIQRSTATLAFVLMVLLLGWRLADQRRKRRTSEAALVAKEAEFRMLAEHSNDLVERFDAMGIRQYASPASLPILGYQPEELIGESAYDLIVPEDLPAVAAAGERMRTGEVPQATVTCRLRRKDGGVIWVEAALRMFVDASGEPAGVIVNTRDITERKLAEQRLAAMASSDGLTGLQNRRAFDQALEEEVARARANGTPLALVLLDVDRFKLYNDEYGHMAGDACLKSIAAVLAMAAKRDGDVAARYGGEELVLLLPETNGSGAAFIAGELCRQIQALAIPHELNAPWNVATVSIGVSTIENRPGDPARDGAWLISTADMALYQAKADGRNRYRSAATEVVEYERDAG